MTTSPPASLPTLIGELPIAEGIPNMKKWLKPSLNWLLAVVVVNQVSQDGECNWLEGVQLISVYVILGIAFYYLPGLHG